MAKILVAEDDQSMCDFLTLALSKAGHKVTARNNGLDALQTLEDSKCDYDLLLADIVMPGIDGIELSQRASTLCPKLKVMFITGFAAVAMSQTVSTGLKNKNTPRILSKPFHLNDLVKQVEQLLSAA